MAPSQKKNRDTYSVTVSCSNCGFHGSINISKGTTVNASRCPHCGCQTVGLQYKERPEPRMKFHDIWNDPVDRGLRPKELPWLNTIMSSVADEKEDQNLRLTYSNHNGKEDFSVKLNGKEVNLNDKELNRAVDKVLKELGL